MNVFLFPRVTATSDIFVKIGEKKYVCLTCSIIFSSLPQNIRVKHSVLSSITQYSLINIYQHFGGNLCLLQ
jgi:hypothetical protein